MKKTQLLNDLRNRKRYWELNRNLKIRKKKLKRQLNIEHKEEIHAIYHNSTDVIISSIFNNNNNNNNNNNDSNFTFIYMTI